MFVDLIDVLTFVDDKLERYLDGIQFRSKSAYCDAIASFAGHQYLAANGNYAKIISAITSKVKVYILYNFDAFLVKYVGQRFHYYIINICLIYPLVGIAGDIKKKQFRSIGSDWEREIAKFPEQLLFSVQGCRV